MLPLPVLLSLLLHQSTATSHQSCEHAWWSVVLHNQCIASDVLCNADVAITVHSVKPACTQSAGVQAV